MIPVREHNHVGSITGMKSEHRNNKQQLNGEPDMQKWVCVPCGYVYDPEVGDIDSGVEPGTPFEDLPDDWVCPVCGVDKSLFEPYEERR